MKDSVTLAPDFFQGHAALPVAYLNAGQLDEAQRQVDISLALNPDYVAAQEILGLILFSKGEYGNAADTLAAVVKEMPCRKTGHYYLSRALDNSVSTKEASDQMEMAGLLASKGGCQLVEPLPEPRAAVVVVKDWVQKKLRDHRMQCGNGSIASGLISSRPSKVEARTFGKVFEG
jgi:tetratricopeptide (TPR) repeat protein